MSRFFSALVVVASIGSVLYLGGLEAMIVSAVMNGYATLTFDWLEPIESIVFMPFLILMALVVGLRELKRLSEK